jgi:hypothetical protein
LPPNKIYVDVAVFQGKNNSRQERHLQLEIVDHNCDLGTCDRQNNVNEQQKPENVIVLVHPYGAHDEEELNEAGTEWK